MLKIRQFLFLLFAFLVTYGYFVVTSWEHTEKKLPEKQQSERYSDETKIVGVGESRDGD
jgi:hypothetical protein